jgi:hypothetical protein
MSIRILKSSTLYAQKEDISSAHSKKTLDNSTIMSSERVLNTDANRFRFSVKIG